MATLVRLGRAYIRMFANDHYPPHFHIWTPDGEAMVLLEDFSLMRGVVRRDELKMVQEWARKNRDMLDMEWRRLNG